MSRANGPFLIGLRSWLLHFCRCYGAAVIRMGCRAETSVAAFIVQTLTMVSDYGIN